jgi:Lantibiotic dehydratase, N terminus
MRRSIWRSSTSASSRSPRCATPRLADGRATFLRTARALVGGRLRTFRAEEVSVAHRRPLDIVVAAARTGTPLEVLASLVTQRLQPPSVAAARRFVRRLVDAGILVPCWPVDPQGADPLDGIATWLRSLGEDRLAADVAAVSLAVRRFPAATDRDGAVAPRPDAAASAVRAARVSVSAAAADPCSVAVLRSLSRFGTTVDFGTAVDSMGSAQPPGRVLLAGGGHAVAVQVAGEAGYVTAPGGADNVRADAARLAARLGLSGVAEPGPLTALTAGAAVARLVAAIAGLPDPSSYGDDPRVPDGYPAVLIATAQPLRAEYHPWLGQPAEVRPPATLAEALRRADALADPVTGYLSAPQAGRLPQLPAALAGCEVGGAQLVAASVRLDLARLEAICLAAELLLGNGCTVGVDPGHAEGRALRRAAHGLCGTPCSGWADDRDARHWWNTLTVRLGVPAHARVTRLADGVFHAEIDDVSHAEIDDVFHTEIDDVSHTEIDGVSHTEIDGVSHAEIDGPYGWAVEATPGAAVAFAALGAIGAVQVPAARHVAMPSGALGRLTEPSIMDNWVKGVAEREPGLCARLRALVGRPRPPESSAYPGFTVLDVSR